ncbi:MAG TPA: hypothetical protein VFK01_11660, partial [Bradyrhizobium sp.]|nr:hypothetical protein [Bradyrhizobium sp.]
IFAPVTRGELWLFGGELRVMSSEDHVLNWKSLDQIAKFSITGLCVSMVMAFGGFYGAMQPWFF